MSTNNNNQGQGSNKALPWIMILGIGGLLVILALATRGPGPLATTPPTVIPSPGGGVTPVTTGVDPAVQPVINATSTLQGAVADPATIVTGSGEVKSTAVNLPPSPAPTTIQIELLNPPVCAPNTAASYSGDNIITFRWKSDWTPATGEYQEIRINGQSIGRVPDTAKAATEWAYQVPAAIFYEQGVTDYTWELVNMAADRQTKITGSPKGCFSLSGGPSAAGGVAPAVTVPPTEVPSLPEPTVVPTVYPPVPTPYP